MGGEQPFGRKGRHFFTHHGGSYIWVEMEAIYCLWTFPSLQGGGEPGIVVWGNSGAKNERGGNVMEIGDT